MWSALLLACVSTRIGLGGGSSGEVGHDAETVPDAEVPDADCSSLYDPDVLQDFELTLSDADLGALADDFAQGVKAYHPAVFTWHRPDGDEVVDAQVRLKGNPDFSWVGDKWQLVVAFDQDDPDARFHGVRKTSFDAPWYDPTLLHERVAMSYLHDAGLPYSCADSARLSVNGAYYGLYANLEYVDHEYLERNFGDDEADGALWKYGSELVGQDPDADPTDLNRFFRSRSVDGMAELMDEDETVLEWAAEAVVGDGDGYWCCEHNFYVYDHPRNGLTFVPWDLDFSVDIMGSVWPPTSGWAAQFSYWVQDRAGEAAYVDAVAAATAAYDPDALVARVDAWADQIDAAYREDARRSHSDGEHDDMVERMRRTIPSRRAYLDAWVASAQGVRADADGDGVTVASDCDDGDATVAPGASEACNGRDDDCDGVIDEDRSCDDCIEHAFDGARFLVCFAPRTADEAAADCAAQGAASGAPATYQEQLLLLLQAYYVTTDRDFWTTGCDVFDLYDFTTEARECGELHPAICRFGGG